RARPAQSRGQRHRESLLGDDGRLVRRPRAHHRPARLRLGAARAARLRRPRRPASGGEGLVVRGGGDRRRLPAHDRRRPVHRWELGDPQRDPGARGVQYGHDRRRRRPSVVLGVPVSGDEGGHGRRAAHSRRHAGQPRRDDRGRHPQLLGARPDPSREPDDARRPDDPEHARLSRALDCRLPALQARQPDAGLPPRGLAPRRPRRLPREPQVTTAVYEERLERMWQSRPGVLGWVMTTDHKRIGLLYFWTTLVLFAAGGAEALLMRTPLIQPDEHVVGPATYDELFTMHGVTMIFFFIIPMTTGAFGNYLLPLMIGARDMAFPRMNALSYWVFLASGIFVYTSLFIGQAPNAGWFDYVPLASPKYDPGHAIAFHRPGIILSGISPRLTAA